MASNRFRRGSGCYKCSTCDRLTRNSGQATESQDCFQCWELAGIQNAVWDGESVSDYSNDIAHYLDAIQAGGGSVEKVKAEFKDLFPKVA